MSDSMTFRCPGVSDRAAEAERFARGVADAIVQLRGWKPGTEPAAVRDDVFRSMTRHEARYVAGFTVGADPGEVARSIQWAEWDTSRAVDPW